jgi:hypothetical protein
MSHFQAKYVTPKDRTTNDQFIASYSLKLQQQ